MFSKKNKKGFTLIEMLIVIVIIGILAAALIPRLSSARGRANDVARKADLAQVASAIVSYQIDNGKFLDCTTWCTLSALSTGLISAWMNSIPADPNSTRKFTGIESLTITGGQYGYITIVKWWIDNNGFVLMAGAETEWWSNRVSSWTIGQITNSTNYSDINLCKTFDSTCPVAEADADWKCCYDKNWDQLRYIYLY